MSTYFVPCTYCGFATHNLWLDNEKLSQGTKMCPCYRVTYCDYICQKRDWKKHKWSCIFHSLQGVLTPDALRQRICGFCRPSMCVSGSQPSQDAGDRAQMLRDGGSIRAPLRKIGFWPGTRGGLGISPFHAMEVVTDCMANKTKQACYDDTEG